MAKEQNTQEKIEQKQAKDIKTSQEQAEQNTATQQNTQPSQESGKEQKSTENTQQPQEQKATQEAEQNTATQLQNSQESTQEAKDKQSQEAHLANAGISLPALPEVDILPTQPQKSQEKSQESTQKTDLSQDLQVDFMQKLTNALNENATWKEQIYATLQGLSVLLERFNNIKNTLSKSHNVILNDKNTLDSKKELLNAQYEHFLETIRIFNLYFDNLKTALSANTQIIIANMNTCIEQALLCENTLSDTKKECVDILGYRQDILLTLEKLNALNAQKEELLVLFAKGEALRDEIKSTQEAIITTLESKKDEILANFEVKNGELITALQQAKESLEANLNATKEQGIQTINDAISGVDRKITELEQSFLDKKAQLNLANTELSQARQSLENAKTEFEAKKDEYIAKLQEVTTNHTLTLSQEKDAHIVTLAQQVKEHSDNLADLKTKYKSELDSANAAEMAELKKFIEQIQARTTQFGSNFKRITYTNNATFTPSEDNIYYYVFLQGGKGVDNSNQSGGITSFGSFLSAKGGAGGTNGKGMQGECKGGFVDITNKNPINISVGSGGICIIS